MSDRVEASKAESTVPYFGELADKLGTFADQHGLLERLDNGLRAVTGLQAPKDGILPSVEFVNPKGEKETDTPFITKGIQYEIDDSPSDHSHLFG